jgi:hypothetical protein
MNQISTPKDDPLGFADLVVSLYKDEKRLEELSERGSKFVEKTFTRERTEALMNTILSSSRETAAARIAASTATRATQQAPRAIAFYLPQYHPIPENDEWWGKGFTEWRNVAKAKPLFPGHYQPHIPADLGFYDLRLEETRIAQAELAREYGIHGFCYYHYWFNGKRLLERPLEDMLKSGKPDFPFCICWANENWTRRWDGEDQQVLMKLEYSEEDDRRHIRELFRIFEDRRYIRVNGKPLFLVYRTENLPDPGRTAEIWREEARQAGVGELYLCRVESIGRCDPRTINFDASLEFAPDWHRKGPMVKTNNKTLNERLGNLKIPDGVCEKNYVHLYDELASNMSKKPMPDYPWLRCVTPSWDNTARRLEGAHIFIGSTPERYRNWLRHAIRYTNTWLKGEEKLVFINAWNEWAEGNYLEPDQHFGRAYLEATRNALLSPAGSESMEPDECKVSKEEILVNASKLLPDLGSLLAEQEQLLDNLKQRLETHKLRLKDHERELSEREERIQDILNSGSWKVAKPLRRGSEILKIKKKP